MKNKAFTLSEVLIAIVVIGIVAAITIPILQQKYEKRKLYSQFMKTYSTLNQAMNMSIASGNSPSGFDFTSLQGSKANAQIFLDTYIKPYVKIINTERCLGIEEENPQIKDLTGRVLGTACQIQEALALSDSLILSDGATITVMGQGFEDFGQIIVDVNASKGPNILGRDIHAFRYWGKTDKPKITGCAHTTNSFNESYYRINCDPKNDGREGSFPGDTCADRLLREGKMAY